MRASVPVLCRPAHACVGGRLLVCMAAPSAGNKDGRADMGAQRSAKGRYSGLVGEAAADKTPAPPPKARPPPPQQPASSSRGSRAADPSQRRAPPPSRGRSGAVGGPAVQPPHPSAVRQQRPAVQQPRPPSDEADDENYYEEEGEEEEEEGMVEYGEAVTAKEAERLLFGGKDFTKGKVNGEWSTGQAINQW